MRDQLIAVLGAVLVLAAYFAYQRGWLSRRHRSYHLLNLVGASCLAWVAILDQRWGFILVEVAWALLSVPGSIRPGALAGERGNTDGPAVV